MNKSREIIISPNGVATTAEAADFIQTVLGTSEIAKATRHFLTVKLANEHTRASYKKSAENFLRWCYERRLGVDVVDTEILDHYRDHLASQHSVSTVNNKLSGISRYYKHLISEHLIKHNPADKTEREKLERKGKTPLIPEKDARKVLDSIDTSDVVGLRDRAILSMLAFIGLRVGAIAKITLGAFEYDGDKPTKFWVREKRGKEWKVPVRAELQDWLLEYMEAAGLVDAPKSWHLFRAVDGKTKRLRPYSPAQEATDSNPATKARGQITANHMNRMFKRRLTDADISTHYSCHSFRVTVITDLLKQGIEMSDVRNMVGHSDSRTTELYDRREHEVTQNLVERISI